MIRDYSELLLRIRGKYARLGDFAKAPGVTNGTLSNKLSGKSEWSRAEIEKAADLLELTADEIISYFFNV